MGFSEGEELDTLYGQQETVRKMAYRIKNYLFEMSDEPKGEPKTLSSEKIRQMILYEMETADILTDILKTLPSLGKGE